MTALLFAGLLALMLAAPLANAQEQETQYVPFVFQVYFLYGSSIGECDANCVGSCFPSCYAGAAATGGGTSNCGSVCPARCASECAAAFSNAYQPNDGLPEVAAAEPECSYGSYTACEVPQQAMQEVAPSWPTIPEDAPSLEGQGMEGGTTDDWHEQGGAGITIEPQTCPATAPNGHPLRWDQIWGCYDIFWKNDYCAVATGCNTGSVPCTSRQGCIWNGAACTPCNAPTCIYSCPAAGGAAAAPAARVKAVQRDIPAPIAFPARQASSATPTTAPSVAPDATALPSVAPTAPPAPTATPTPKCGNYGNCNACVKAPKEAGENYCGWSEFLGACVDGDTWRAVNASGLKVGWGTEEKYCTVQADAYCFEFTDCFSCAGNAGVKRRCQWSVTEEKCLPYDAFGDFKTANNSKGKDVIVPAMCSERDCSAYSECGKCEGNAACLWSREDKTCVDFKGDGNTDEYFFFPGNCQATTAAATPTPTPVPCPENCACDSLARVVRCGVNAVNGAGLVRTDRALVNAGAGSPMQRVGNVTFNEAGGNSTYVVRGFRDGLMLFFPVTVDVTTTLNARTGAIEKVEQPWWSFLAG
ncbi:hypothetical protein AUJ16_02430 [Candidatus Micrarchaeota archaeon CG1_02_60_51]|nr:MAG: hypothetical protein AUJ16_02430 [Candidatus Micrarchaeota archaeon CG1_02_60_51]PIO01755.1 MAG: hypothetical protein COT58_03510 [Candidatus Micrarchaeota archaeon CG09_land_8_20_14_0_10_60_16]